MPAKGPPQNADLGTSNSQVNGQDVVLGGAIETDADSHKASSHMGTNRNASTSSILPAEEARSHAVDASGTIAKNGRHTSQDASLLIPSEGGVRTRPIETSIWDWDTPLESVGESYYYEPQGELLQERREQREVGTEFSIPHAISTSASQWPFPASPIGSSGNDGFAIPKRPSGLPSSVAGSKRKSTSDREAASSGKQQDQKRLSKMVSDSGGDEVTSPSLNTRSQSGTATRPRSTTETSEGRPGSSVTEVEGARPLGGSSGPRTLPDSSMPMVLPARKVFPIQIGDKLFRLSGASISSDAPSYFSQFFEEQLRSNEGADSVRTLYIDRDPATFEDISLHLQGYHVEPRDGPHFVKLFADAQFFSLPRLTAQLFASTIYIRIGDEEFQIPRDLFSNPGDSPNYFSLGFSIFFTTPNEVFPGLSQRTLLRPPSILPPSVPNRSARTFADLLHILKGYPVEIRSEEHRTELLKDARYFHLKGLEQRLIPHQISYNLARKKTEILIRIEDIRQSGISFVADTASQASASTSPESASSSSIPTGPGWVYYQRPYVDSEAHSLIIEINDETTYLAIAPGSSSSTARIGRATFFRRTLARVTSLFSVIANKMNLPVTQPLGLMMMQRNAGVASLPVSPGNTGLSEELVKVRIGEDADVTLDGEKWIVGEDENEEDEESDMDIDQTESSRTGTKRKRNEDDDDDGEDWVVKKAQWRLRVQPLAGGAQAARSGMEVILSAVKIDAYRSERARNAARAFLI